MGLVIAFKQGPKSFKCKYYSCLTLNLGPQGDITEHGHLSGEITYSGYDYILNSVLDNMGLSSF